MSARGWNVKAYPTPSVFEPLTLHDSRQASGGETSAIINTQMLGDPAWAAGLQYELNV